MTTSMHQAAIPTITRALTNLIGVLEKGAAHAEAKKIEPSVLINSRLYPDMFTLGKQVQVVSDIARGGISRLAQVESPKFEDNETTFPELVERLRKTITYLESLKPEQFEGADARDIVLPLRDRKLEFKGLTYLTTFALPNFHFHVTTAYAILRHNGVEIGKTDYLGGSRTE